MRVILKENVGNLGKTGDLVTVSDGYARNYLLPRGLVVFASDKNISQVEHNKRILQKKRLEQLKDAEAIAKRIETHDCTISRKVGKSDKIFGSVTTKDIADQLADSGFQIEKTSVILKDTIKALGTHPVTIKVDTDVEATLKVNVVAQEGDE